MRISVFGLGYVGCVSAACLANDGHSVIGVYVDPKKLDLLRTGRSPITEPGLEELVREVVSSGRLRVSSDSQAAVRDTEVSIICVGTPSSSNGSPTLDHVKDVIREISLALGRKNEYHVVVVRSTVPPDTVLGQLVPLIEQSSGLCAGLDFGVCMNPEFLREGSAIKDYYHPGLVVIGQLDQRSGDVAQQMYSAIQASIERTAIPIAEMAKYTSNAFNAVKITFANEIGNLCKAHGIDGREVMDLFCKDQNLNTSAAYLKPGFAFGGSCLPKDLRALVHRAKERDLDLPLLNAVLQSNRQQLQHGIELIERTGRHKIGVLGLSFKADTDDVSESPVIPLVETLIGRGFDVRVYDERVEPGRLIGANRSFLERALPHIASLLCPSVSDLLEEAEVIVVTNHSRAFGKVPKLLRQDQILVDLAGIARRDQIERGEYEGICW